MKHFLLLFIISTGFLSLTQAQHALSLGHYSFNEWPANSLPGSYPDHIVFYFLNTTSDPIASTDLSDPYELAYNLTTSSRIRGLGNDGVSFINTANAQHHPQGHQLGAAVLSLNTINRFNIQVNWTGKTIQTGGRTHALQLFYRTSPNHAWEIALDENQLPIIYLTQPLNGQELILDPWTLPTILENQSHIQLMWKYYEHSSSDQQGTRSQLAIKTIDITSEGLNDPTIQFIAENEYTLHPSSIPTIDSIKIRGSQWATGLNIHVSPPFEISFDRDQNFMSELNYISIEEEDSIMIYLGSPQPENGWNEVVISAQVDQINTSINYLWYYVNSRLPEPLILAEKNYLFNEWPSNSPAGSYPDHMSFQMTEGDHYSSTSFPLIYDWNCAYNLSARSRFYGENDWGILFLNTSAPQWDECEIESSLANKFIGAVTLLANTENVDSAELSFYIMMLYQANVSQPRKYEVQLQVRKSPLDTFSNYSLSTYYPAYDVLNFDEHWVNLRLDDSLLNQPFVEFRWLYYDTAPGVGTGIRPTYRLDEISLVNLGIPLEEEEEEDISIDEPLHDKVFYMYPNPIANGQTLNFSKTWSGTVLNLEGKIIESLEEVKEWSISNLPTGIYFLKSSKGEQVQKIHIIQ